MAEDPKTQSNLIKPETSSDARPNAQVATAPGSSSAAAPVDPKAPATAARRRRRTW